MLGKNYLTLGGIPIPNPIVNNTEYKNIERVNESEAGTDLVNVVRLQKKNFKLTFNSSSFWLDKFEELCKVKQTTLEYRGNEMQVRARLISADLVEDSANAVNTDGLYEVNIEVTEI